MAAFINVIAKEGTKAEAIEWLRRVWDENCELRIQAAAQESIIRDQKYEIERLRGLGQQAE